MTEEIRKMIENDRRELMGDFCRGCGYCMPCPKGILINNCARMSLLLRRAPSKAWLSETWQKNMKQIEECIGCGQCEPHCPQRIRIPRELQRIDEFIENLKKQDLNSL
jgi:predicted aldo/keto reductase-like oxidoreductase